MDPTTFVHPTAVVDPGASIGAGSKVWHFCHVSAGARIGAGSVLGQNVFVGGTAVVGNGCKIANNVSLYDGVELGPEVFVGPSVVFTNVKTPRAFISRRAEFLKTRVGRGASIGANATIVCGRTLGTYCFVAAGAVVTHDVAAFALVAGVPARRQGWVCRCGVTLAATTSSSSSVAVNTVAPGRLTCPACAAAYLVGAGGDGDGALRPLAADDGDGDDDDDGDGARATPR
jgi:UDP-2-acetamido-3-amino-2,3-dideoxy-glucuronate N-acetyltransferase